MERLKGTAFRVAGLVLGIVGTAISVCAIVMASIGLSKAKKYRRR